MIDWIDYCEGALKHLTNEINLDYLLFKQKISTNTNYVLHETSLWVLTNKIRFQLTNNYVFLLCFLCVFCATSSMFSSSNIINKDQNWFFTDFHKARAQHLSHQHERKKIKKKKKNRPSLPKTKSKTPQKMRKNSPISAPDLWANARVNVVLAASRGKKTMRERCKMKWWRIWQGRRSKEWWANLAAVKRRRKLKRRLRGKLRELLGRSAAYIHLFEPLWRLSI